MHIIFKSPTEYKEEMNLHIMASCSKMNDEMLIVPEGGTNEKGVIGAMEIMQEVANQSAVKFDFIVVSVGTGGTLAGISKSSPKGSIIYAMSPFKSEITQIAGHEWLASDHGSIQWINVSEKSKFGSYQSGVSDYINQFYNNYDILLEPIYTARAMSGLDKLILNGDVPKGSKMLFIHTGGLQGIMGYNYLHSDKACISIPQDYAWLANPLTTFG
jgi:1-aminocyclopropane-1-carboxylate deaminase